MAASLSQHEAAAKALESELLSSHTRSDYELIEHEGKMLAKLMFGISLLDKDARRKILGPILTEFSAEYMEARKAIRGGQDPKTFKFDRRWETMQKGKAPERRPNLPAMDLSQLTKKKVEEHRSRKMKMIADFVQASKPQQEAAGPSKPALSQQPPSKTPAAKTTKLAGEKSPARAPSKVDLSFNLDKSAAPPSTLQGLAAVMASVVKPNPVPPQKAATASKPPAPKPPAAKPPAKAPVAKRQRAPAKAKKAAALAKPVKGPEHMDVDEPEGRETDKKRRERGEPNTDEDATDYADERTGEKRKAASAKGGKKKAKSAAIIATDSEDVPLAKASKSTAVGTTVAKATTSAAAVHATVKAGPVKLRSNFRKFLPPDVVAQFDAMMGTGKITDDEEAAYLKWTDSLPKKFRPIKGLRDNTPRAVVLMGETLTPPRGLTLNEKICDWCKDFAPMRCFVIDQGTACLICNIFLKKGCTVNREKVNPYHGGRKPATKPKAGKKAADPDTSGARAPATTKTAEAKSRASTSKLGPISHPTSSADVHTQALDELHATQAQQAASIRAIQSQMGTMALGMAACGSMLKTAKEELERHATETQELEGTVAERSNTLADAIARLQAAQGTNLPDPSAITHDLIERHLDNLGQLIHAGAQFSELFVALATDVTNTTRALSQWLTGSPDVEMRDREDEETEEEDFPIEPADQEGDTYRIYSD